MVFVEKLNEMNLAFLKYIIGNLWRKNRLNRKKRKSLELRIGQCITRMIFATSSLPLYREGGFSHPLPFKWGLNLNAPNFSLTYLS